MWFCYGTGNILTGVLSSSLVSKFRFIGEPHGRLHPLSHLSQLNIYRTACHLMSASHFALEETLLNRE